MWAVPLPPSWGSYHDQHNEARWIPALPRRDWQRDEMEQEIALYQVTLVAGLNEVPRHPIAIFRPGYDWKFICPPNYESAMYLHPAGTDACLTSVTKLESGSFFTGGAWNAEAEATVRLEKDGLKDAGSPAVRCQGEELAETVCETRVEPAEELKNCNAKILRIWQPDRTAWHNVDDVELQTDEAGRTLLTWPFLPAGELQGVDHPTRERRPPAAEIPPQTFTLLACGEASSLPKASGGGNLDACTDRGFPSHGGRESKEASDDIPGH